MTRTNGRIRLAGALLALACAATAQVDTGAGRGRGDYVRKLIEDSSAAKQVESSPNAQAREHRELARRLYAEAVEAAGAGDAQRADELYTQAAKTMFDAVRLAESREVLAGKKEGDYQDRLASVKALLEAHGRISAEKGDAAGHAGLERIVGGKLAEADGLRAGGDLAGARAMLDEAYLSAKVGIESLRDGETLVRSLNFASKEEEFRYEVDRNDTHRMLVDVLLKEKLGDANVEKMVATLLERAAAIRGEAEAQAARGDHAGAVTRMEESTREIVKAIRSAGVYIPG